MKRQGGLALIVIAGLLTLLAVFGAAWTRLAVLLRETAGMTLDKAQAQLLARSGVEYASARLLQDPSPRIPPTPGNQADDWTYRDGAGVSLEKGANPSYAQGEPYVDLNGNAKYDPVGDLLPAGSDWNANGRFDSWSGRLRDRHGMTGGTFVLKVLGESGKINLNGGWLDARDRNGDGHYNYDQWVPPTSAAGNGVFDFHDIEEIRNRRYVLLLDTLGQIADVSSTNHDPAQLQNGAASHLGNLLKGRPLGGFQSMEEVRGQLSPGDWKKVGDFLTVVDSERAAFSVSDRIGTAGSDATNVRHLGAEARPLVNLSTAPREVLQALAQGLRLPARLPLNWIDPPMAIQTADYLVSNRPFASGSDLYAKLRSADFTFDPAGALGGAGAGAENIVYGEIRTDSSWAQIVFGNLTADEVGGYYKPYGLVNRFQYFWFPPMSWNTYDDPHATAADHPHFRPMSKMGSDETGSVNISDPCFVAREEGGRPPLPSQCNQPPGVYNGGTLEASLIPREAAAFSLDCVGRSGTDSGRSPAMSAASARLRLGAVVSARTQAEFENLSGFTDRGYYRVTGRSFKDRTQTEPQFSVDSLPKADRQAYLHLYPDASLYSPFWGTVRLADRSGYRQGERFYVPAWDVDQPLRPPVDSPSFEDNFSDISGGLPLVFKWSLSNGTMPLAEIAFRGERATSYCCAAAPGFSAPGTYTWPAGQFPLDDGSGSVSRGAIELWTTGAPGGISATGGGLPGLTSSYGLSLIWGQGGLIKIDSVQSGLHSIGVFLSPAGEYSSSPILLGDWHHLVLSFDSGSAPTMQGYLDGKPDPFLTIAEWHTQAINATNPTRWDMTLPPSQGPPDLASELDELRLYDRALGPSEAMARALSSRYWTEEQFPPADWTPAIAEHLREVPSFTSPFYLFPRPVLLEGARWDGFVPQVIQQAVDGDGLTPGNPANAPPMKVELLCYPGPDPEAGDYRVVPFPVELQRAGGGWAEFKAMWKAAYGDEPIPRFRGFRYRVWMDCSAVGGFNPETPVFDSISVVVRTGGKLLGLSEH